MELFTKLGIDWRLLFAQVVNFTLLLFVLYRFLYNPLIAVLEKRRRQIEENEKKSSFLEERLHKVQEDYQKKLQEARIEAEKIIAEAQERASQTSREILENAQKRAEEVIADAYSQAEQEREKVLKEIQQEAGELIKNSLEKILYSIADEQTSSVLYKRAANAIEHFSKQM